MAWENSDRRLHLPANWASTRKRIFRRDGYRCTWHTAGERCEGPAEECDHMGDREDHRDEMLRSLCSYHHGKKSGAQGGYARAKVVAGHKKKFRRTEEHPGLL